MLKMLNFNGAHQPKTKNSFYFVYIYRITSVHTKKERRQQLIKNQIERKTLINCRAHRKLYAVRLGTERTQRRRDLAYQGRSGRIRRARPVQLRLQRGPQTQFLLAQQHFPG